jgi:dUTP pyrophosphatase
MEPENPVFRRTIFDFKNMPNDPEVASRIVKDEKRGLGYRMKRGESVTIGIGCVTAMRFPMFYWITPRSGLSSREGVTVTNAPGTVDSDYRGEAGVLLYNRDNEYFDVFSVMRVAQDIFQEAIIPVFEEVENYEDLPKTIRGSGGFGSTGLY